MKSILELSKILRVPEEKIKSERASILKDLYALYTSPTERMLRRKENWKRYIKFLKYWKEADSDGQRKSFKKDPGFIKEMPVKSFAIKLAHLNKSDLYYCLSVAKDTNNRNQSVGGWILSQIKSNGN